MESTEQYFDDSVAHSTQLSSECRTCDIAAQFSARGLVKSVEKDTSAQIRREEATCSEEPTYYRLSTLGEECVDVRYRHGKEVMDGEDLLAYFDESRAMRTRDADFSQDVPADELVRAGDAEKRCVSPVRGERRPEMKARLAALPSKIKQLPTETAERVRLSMPLWFNGAKADTRREARRFPLSAFAANPYKFPQDVLYALSGNDVKDSFKGIKRLNLLTAMKPPRSLLDLRYRPLRFKTVVANDLKKMSELILDFVNGEIVPIPDAKN